MSASFEADTKEHFNNLLFTLFPVFAKLCNAYLKVFNFNF